MVAVEVVPASAESPIPIEAKAAVTSEAEAEAEGEVEAEMKGDAAATAGETEEEEEEEEKVYKSDLKKLENLMSKLNPCAQEFVPSSRRTAPAAVAAAKPAGGRVLSADAPVFVSAAEYYGAAGGHLEIGGGGGGGKVVVGGGGRDSSSDGSSNGGGGGSRHQPNRRVCELLILRLLRLYLTRLDLGGFGICLTFPSFL